MKSTYEFLLAMMRILTGWALDPLQLSITNKVPFFKQGILNVKSRIDIVDGLSKMLNLTGIAADKQQAKEIMCLIIISITKPVKSWAISEGNFELRNAVKTPFSVLMKMKTKKLIDKAQALYDLILPLVPQLELAGIAVTAADMQAMSDSITAFSAISNSPETAIQDRKSVNQSIVNYIREANDICHNVLDENIVSFKNDPLYVQQYHIKRQANPVGLRHTRLDATVVNELGVGYPYCKITVNEFTKKGRTYKAVSGFADADGKKILSKFEEGVRSVTISGEGLVTKTFSGINFEIGKAVIELFVCEPSFTNIPAPAEQKQNENA